MKRLSLITMTIFLQCCGPLPAAQPVEKSQTEQHQEALVQHAQVIDMLVSYIEKLQERNILPTAKSLRDTEELFKQEE